MSLRRLAADVRRAEATVSARRSALYAAIRQAHAEGRSYQAIAEEVGVTRARVQQVCADK